MKQPVTEEALGSLTLRLTWVVVQFNVQGDVIALCVEITLAVDSLKSLASSQSMTRVQFDLCCRWHGGSARRQYAKRTSHARVCVHCKRQALPALQVNRQLKHTCCPLRSPIVSSSGSSRIKSPCVSSSLDIKSLSCWSTMSTSPSRSARCASTTMCKTVLPAGSVAARASAPCCSKYL